MTLPLALLVLLLLGCVVNLAAFVWNCVLCGRHGVLWLLAFLFVPFVGLVFLVKYWSEAKRPFFLSLAGTGMMMAPVLLNPQAFAKGFGDRFSLPTGGQPPRPAGANGQAAQPTASEVLQREQAAQEESDRRQRRAQEIRGAYEKHRAEADALFKDLNTRRAKLKVDDAKAVAVFNADATRYAALLEQAKTERIALEPGIPATAANPPAELAAKAMPPAPAVAKPVPALAASNPGSRKTTGTTGTAGEAASLPKRVLDKARAARDAASGAEDAGPFAGEVYGSAPSSPRR